LRQRVVDAHARGEGSFVSLAKRFGVGEASVNRWVAQQRRVGHVEPRRKRGGTPSDVALDAIEEILERLGDATAAEITAAYNRGRRGESRRHVSSIKRALHRGGYVVKKNA
jgi:transposase